jgi:hypothetical protein
VEKSNSVRTLYKQASVLSYIYIYIYKILMAFGGGYFSLEMQNNIVLIDVTSSLCVICSLCNWEKMLFSEVSVIIAKRTRVSRGPHDSLNQRRMTCSQPFLTLGEKLLPNTSCSYK